jgi:ABC-type bacteriocin/lantibiotic exporter with double-glycine peptidase domain
MRSFPDFAKAFRESYFDAVACGPYALIAVLKHLDVPLSEKDCQNLLSLAGTSGTNLLQLKKAAEDFGLQTAPLELSPGDLAEIGMPAIVHLDGTLFAAVLGYPEGTFHVKYPEPSLTFRNFFTLKVLH